jgi:hypothetical protein
MANMDGIAQERKKLADRLARLDAEREKLAEQLNELEVAERVLSRFGRPAGLRRRRGRPAAAAAAPAAAERMPAAAERKAAAGRRPGAARKAVAARMPAVARKARGRAAVSAQGVSLSDAALRIVEAHSGGISAGDVLGLLTREYGLTVRPNHLGIALQRHRRGGRLEQRDSLWYPPAGAQ